ncbi:MAG: alpha-L-fucosidase [Clostridia bacterium]|nr:alpha-L-fucosidase [Clostridia bacterium]
MKYDSTWESLDSRPVPEWFADAKFGIFIHWGLYSVPAFANKGGLAEWYLHALKNECEHHAEFVEHHEKIYGKNKRYEDFVTDFTAENFNAKEWIDLFTRAGARYMNLVSKHHDGFCMYKSDYAWNWNSVDVGPGRDFCRELKDACEGTPVRFGVYHSIYEWYNPLFLKDPEEYSRKHLLPMLKELIEKYEPATLFIDGEWDYPDDTWHSREFLQWLYNESPVKDYIVPNDRWGKNTRGVHGGNFTTEYGVIGLNNEVITDREKPREECRGIAGSFGWNKFETAEDYLTEGALIKMFVDLVSQGSNLLLNVGPTPDGRIPVIMQERLLQMGEWLKTNGEGIYGTRKYAVKDSGDVRYTKKGDVIYAFLLKFPFGSIVLDDVDYTDGIKVSLMGYDGEIKAENENGKLKLVFGAINPDEVKSKYVYGFKIE